MTSELSPQDKSLLLRIARDSITRALHGESLLSLELGEYSPQLQEMGACFVTLTEGEMLRGCVGSIEASQPLVLDVRDRALAAAFQDPRFPPLSERELAVVEIEISILTSPEPLNFQDPEELPSLLKPGIDGVILTHQFRRATFLPQVWEKLPDTSDFLSQLCNKMGAPGDLWQNKPLKVYIYQVQEFQED